MDFNYIAEIKKKYHNFEVQNQLNFKKLSDRSHKKNYMASLAPLASRTPQRGVCFPQRKRGTRRGFACDSTPPGSTTGLRSPNFLPPFRGQITHVQKDLQIFSPLYFLRNNFCPPLTPPGGGGPKVQKPHLHYMGGSLL